METFKMNGAVVSTAHLATLTEIQNGDMALLYTETISEIAEYITQLDDPDLKAEKQLAWLRALGLIKSDIITLSSVE